jgi:hypothetical protein
MLCLSFRAVGTKFGEGDRLPRLTGCPLKFSFRFARRGLTEMFGESPIELVGGRECDEN